MVAKLIDLRQDRHATDGDLAGLQAYLAQLVGEPFRFARVSYGDELTLHFGDLRPARSPKVGKKLYGAYILGVRGSAWLLKSESELQLIAAGIDLDNVPSELGTPISKEQLEANPIIQPESRVLSVTAFVVKPVNAFALELRASDGSAFLILPTSSEGEADDEATDRIQLADWELSTPGGLLSAGPDLRWSFKAKAASASTSG